MAFTPKDRYGINDLLNIIQVLRAPGGCPWDAEQTHQSIRKNLIEETYEVAEAIDLADDKLLCEELGDLMLQVVLHTQMATEAGNFTFDDVCDGICQKLIYRHPHVFGDMSGELSTGQVLRNWESLKNTEKGRATVGQRLDSVPASLPALMRSEKVQKRAAGYGFCYAGAGDALEDLAGEVEELRQALEDGVGVEGEVGDVLFSAVNVARMVGCDAEEALTQSTDKFVSRVKAVDDMAAAKDKTLEQLDAQELNVLWKRAKSLENR